MQELTLKDVKFVFDRYVIDSEDITSDKIKAEDKYVGYFGNTVEELFENIKKNKIRECCYYKGLGQSGFNDSYINSLPALAMPPMAPFNCHVRYCLPFGIVENYKMVKCLVNDTPQTEESKETEVQKIYSVNEQTLIDLHQYLIDEYEEDNTNADAIRLLELLDKILGWTYTYYNPDVDED